MDPLGSSTSITALQSSTKNQVEIVVGIAPELFSPVLVKQIGNLVDLRYDSRSIISLNFADPG